MKQKEKKSEKTKIAVRKDKKKKFNYCEELNALLKV